MWGDVFLSSGNRQLSCLNRAHVVTYENSGKEDDAQVWKDHRKLMEGMNDFKMWCWIHVHFCLLLLCLDHTTSWRGIFLLTEESLLCPVIIIWLLFLWYTAHIQQPWADYIWGLVNVIRSFTDFICLTSWKEKKDHKEWACLDLRSIENISLLLFNITNHSHNILFSSILL